MNEKLCIREESMIFESVAPSGVSFVLLRSNLGAIAKFSGGPPDSGGDGEN